MSIMAYGQNISQLVGRKLNETMLHTLTILTVMRLLSEGKSIVDFTCTKYVKYVLYSAQLNCNEGYVSYERIPNHQLVGFQETTLVRDVLDPAEMVEKCIDWCQGSNEEGRRNSNETSVACGFFNLQASSENVGYKIFFKIHNFCRVASLGVG